MKRFHFIVCTNDALRMQECRRYIQRLIVPEGWCADVTAISDARSMTEGYNRAAHLHPGDEAQTKDVPVRIYLHQDVYIVNPYFLLNLLTVFETHPDVMLLGMAGTPELNESGIMWAGTYIGNVYTPTDEPYEAERLDASCTVTDADSVDGYLMVTRADIPWREDLFDGFDFYDVSQSREFATRGLRVAVADQKTPWCVHDDGRILSLARYDHYRRIFLEHYAN